MAWSGGQLGRGAGDQGSVGCRHQDLLPAGLLAETCWHPVLAFRSLMPGVPANTGPAGPVPTRCSAAADGTERTWLLRTRAPVVGRDAELDVLELALAGARSGRGGAVFLVGEPGIGRSRLAVEAASRAIAAGMRVLRGRGSTIGPTVPLRPLIEALLSAFRDGDPPGDGDLGPYRAVLGRLVPEWGTTESPRRGESIVVLAEAVLRLVGILSRDRGCLLALDDLQDADTETLAVLEYLVDNIQAVPAMLVATIRDELCDALDLANAAVQHGSGVVLPLERLERDDVRRLMSSWLDTEPSDVPETALERLWDSSAGNPFVLEELLYGMVSAGLLRRVGKVWRVVGELRVEIPVNLARSVVRWIDRLGSQGRLSMSVAALLGHRFPVPVVQLVTGIDDRTLLSCLRSALAARLITTDEPAPDWYAFRHPLIGEALLAQLTPTDRAELSRSAARAIERLHPELPGEWCQLVASLRVHSGDVRAAALQYAEAGRRALADGATASAVALLERADRLLAGRAAVALRADVLDSLLYALAETGEVERAYRLAETFNWPGAGLDGRHQAALHVRLARAALVAGRCPESAAQLTAARELLGPDPADADAAPLDAVAADLMLAEPGGNRVAEAEALARQALVRAERASLPAIICQAWQTIGTAARERDLAEAGACFEQARTIAEAHRLPIWRSHALVCLAGNEWLAESDVTGLERARQEALRIGAINLGTLADAILALHAALCGDFARAARLAEECRTLANRQRLASATRHALLVQAVLAAHQGRRRELVRALAEFAAADGDPEQPRPLLLVCALLEEDRERAAAELARADAIAVAHDASLTSSHLSGRLGLHLLLRVLGGDADWPQYDEIRAAPASRWRWNRQFVLLAKAVLLGRSGKPDRAVAAVAEAQQAATPFAMARHLGLRLVAEAALAAGWGEPENWLRLAESYFSYASIPAVASACCALLRQMGVSVLRRRTGAERVPHQLRTLGVTSREYEVFGLLADRLGNKAIAARLHISPRTVEKHVASLVAKAGQPDRESLHAYAAAFFIR